MKKALEEVKQNATFKALAEKEEKQHREISAIKSIEEAEKIRVEQEERLKGERARISTQEAIGIAEENKSREILIPQKNKERKRKIEVRFKTRAGSGFYGCSELEKFLKRVNSF